MTLAEQIQIVEDNLNEYGVCDITLEEYNYLKDELYSSGCLAGIELGKAELLDKVMQKQRTIIDEDGVMFKAVLLKDIEEMKAEIEE